jgi:predicted HTH domain antitoxin
MHTVVLELPFDALALPGLPPEALAREAQFMLALKLFEIGRLSSGKAARLCEMGRVEFLLAAGRAGVPVASLDDDELNMEFEPND